MFRFLTFMSELSIVLSLLLEKHHMIISFVGLEIGVWSKNGTASASNT